MSKAGFGAALSTLGQGLMQYGVRSMDLDWQREREENLQRLRERQLTLAESEAAATADYREGQLSISRGQLTLAEQEAGNMAAYREGQLGISGQQLALQRDANESLDAHRAGTREAQSQSILVDAAKAGFSLDENNQPVVNPEFDTQRTRNQQDSATVQSVKLLTNNFREQRDAGVPALQGMSDQELELRAFTMATTNPTKPPSVSEKVNAVETMLDSLNEERKQAMFLPAEQKASVMSDLDGRIRTYQTYLDQLLRSTGIGPAAGDEPGPRRFGAGSGVLDLIANDLGLGG